MRSRRRGVATSPCAPACRRRRVRHGRFLSSLVSQGSAQTAARTPSRPRCRPLPKRRGGVRRGRGRRRPLLAASRRGNGRLRATGPMPPRLAGGLTAYGDFLVGQRLAPAAGGRADGRPDFSPGPWRFRQADFRVRFFSPLIHAQGSVVEDVPRPDWRGRGGGRLARRGGDGQGEASRTGRR